MAWWMAGVHGITAKHVYSHSLGALAQTVGLAGGLTLAFCGWAGILVGWDCARVLAWGLSQEQEGCGPAVAMATTANGQEAGEACISIRRQLLNGSRSLLSGGIAEHLLPPHASSYVTHRVTI